MWEDLCQLTMISENLKYLGYPEFFLELAVRSTVQLIPRMLLRDWFPAWSYARNEWMQGFWPFLFIVWVVQGFSCLGRLLLGAGLSTNGVNPWAPLSVDDNGGLSSCSLLDNSELLCPRSSKCLFVFSFLLQCNLAYVLFVLAQNFEVFPKLLEVFYWSLCYVLNVHCIFSHTTENI